jgi:hypothetical protein
MLRPWLAVAFLWLGLLALPAQDAVRTSLASERAAQARKKSLSQGHYNLDLDPVRLRFSSDLSFEANDNVNLRSVDPDEDFILRPQVGIHAYWQVTDRNSLDLALQLGYEYYFNETRPSRFTIAGDEVSGLFFDIFVGDFAITLFDTFSLLQDTSADPSANGVADIFRLENTAGVTVAWDLGDLVLQLDYDHFSYVPFDDINKYLRHDSDLATLRPMAYLNPALIVGLEFGGGVTRYQDDRLSDNKHVSFGPFFRYQATDAMSLRVSLGQARYEFDTSSFITNETSLSSFYADVSLEHRLTPRTAHTLSAGQSLGTDINGAPLKTLYVRYALALNVIRHWGISPRFTYEDGTETRSLTPEDFTRYGAGITLSRAITDKLRAALLYDWLKKTSDFAAYEYTQNRLVLTLSYQF